MPLGKQVFGDLRLGEVVLFRRDRREARGSRVHADLRVPYRSELVRSRRCRKRDRFVVRRVSGLTVGLCAAVATPSTATAAAAVRSALGFLFGRFDLAALDELLGFDDFLFGRVSVHRGRTSELLARQRHELASRPWRS